jgi:hypothetical protein
LRFMDHLLLSDKSSKFREQIIPAA